MKFYKLLRDEVLLKLGLAIAIISVGYLITVFYFQIKNLDQSVAAIENANSTQIELSQLLAIINKNESNLRNFILTEDTIYLKNHFAYRDGLNVHLISLNLLTSRNKEFLAKTDTINQLLRQRYALFDETIKGLKDKTLHKSNFKQRLIKSNKITFSLYFLINKLLWVEAEKVKNEHQKHKDSIDSATDTASGLALLLMLIFLLTFSKMKNDISNQKIAYNELKYLNTVFFKAETIAGFGHWKVNIDRDRFTLSENFYKLMDLNPNTFVPTLENLTANIHPEDKEHVRKAHIESLTDLKPTNIVYRYIMKDGTIRYFRSVGSFTTNNFNETIKIGVNHDITDQQLNLIKLNENNKKLIDINAELESFNNIVSHDLQEPLRKIQMFISRLESEENQKLTEKSTDYFLKIKLAANRMQNLLIDLVDYTKTIKLSKVFTKTDLSSLLHNVIDELSTDIEQYKAVIRTNTLPTLNVIPFQIQQLFINLISNSLKYSKKDIPPIIAIKWIENFNEFVINDQIINANNFVKISIKDNGIGFKQEYAENIFMLFKRLESDLTYSGTGIGLTICKKIIENHSGYIEAYGEENIGSEFVIYLKK